MIVKKVTTYTEDVITYEENFLPAFSNIFNNYSITRATPTQDKEEGTDLFISNGTITKRFAFRVRSGGYPIEDFTIRYSRPSGTDTELDKMCMADYLFYAHSKDNEFSFWVIINLKRLGYYYQNNCILGKIYDNVDNSSQLIVFNLLSMPDDIIFISKVGNATQTKEYLKQCIKEREALTDGKVMKMLNDLLTK